MATIRRAGFGTVFELEDSKVGIGTDAATHTLQALGNVRSEDATVIGISSLTTYQGFVDKEAGISGGQVDIESQSGSTSEEIVIDGNVTVSSATTFTSGPQNLSVTDTFTLPSGNTNSRELKPTAGSLRFNQDFATLEFYTGNTWATVNTLTEITNSPSNRGRMLVMGGGYPSQVTDIQSIQINTQGTSTTFGQLTQARSHNTALANKIRGMCVGGFTPGETDVIDFVTMASQGDAIDFGNLTSSKYGGGGAASSTRGLFCGGYDGPANTNDIDYFEIMTLGDALDFGDLTRARRYPTSVASPTRVVTTGGTGDSYPSTEVGARMTDIFTISSKGNAIDFEPTTDNAQQLAGFTDGIRGIFLLDTPYMDPPTKNQLDQLNLVSGGNAVHHGDLTRLTSAQPAGGCNHVRGIAAGGFNTPGTSTTNHIDMIEIQTSGNAVDFGDLAQKTTLCHGCSDSHGGLGGY